MVSVNGTDSMESQVATSVRLRQVVGKFTQDSVRSEVSGWLAGVLESLHVSIFP